MPTLGKEFLRGREEPGNDLRNVDHKKSITGRY